MGSNRFTNLTARSPGSQREAALARPGLLATGVALPPNRVSQEEIAAALRQAWSGRHHNAERLDELHRAVRVSARHLALPIAEYGKLTGFPARNEAWRQAALALAVDAAARALAAAGVEPGEVGHLLLASTTGVATPSLDALLALKLGLRRGVRRLPLFGLGCAGGAAMLGRAADLLRGEPDGVALAVATEACSLTLQQDDLSVPNVIAAGLFGDGAGAAVLAGAGRARRAGPAAAGAAPRVLASASALYPDTERVMGWDVVDGGFKIVLSARVPEVVRQNLAGDVDGFLGPLGLDRSRIAHWIAHTGGPKVLEAFTGALDLPPSALARSWEILDRMGNLSSASVMFVLDDLLGSGEARPGDLGLLAAMGPGFGSELVLLAWPDGEAP